MFPIIQRLNALYPLQNVDHAEKTAGDPCVTALSSLSNCPAYLLPPSSDPRLLRALFPTSLNPMKFSHKKHGKS